MTVLPRVPHDDPFPSHWQRLLGRLALVRFFFALVIVVATTEPPCAHAQTVAGSNRVVSPTVVVEWQSHNNDDGTGSLGLLVLWRGNPGWFMRGNSSSGGGGANGGFGKWNAYHWMSYGDITLTMEFNSDSKDFPPDTTIVTILGRDIPLRDTNVVLIDDMDSGNPSIVGTRLVNPQFVGNDPVAAVVKRSSELFDFLRCDATMPDSRMQAMVESICGQMRP